MNLRNPNAPASAKQVNLIKSLIAQREPADVASVRAALNDAARRGEVTMAQASEAIEQLFAIPRKARPKVDLDAVEPGYYVKTTPTGDTDVYVVVESKKSGRKYAKRLEISGHGHARWVYERGAVYRLDGLTVLTAEEAARLGHLHGVCVVCAAQLTDPKSVEAGIGPVCRRKLAA